jgi:YD repeat-containing protein
MLAVAALQLCASIPRDLSGRLAVTRDPSGRIVGNAYDALGRVAAFTAS